MVLVVVLAWIDTFHQNTEGIAAVRAQNLEQFLLKKRKLNTQMFVQKGFRHMSWILPAIYSGFLVALFFIRSVCSTPANRQRWRRSREW